TYTYQKADGKKFQLDNVRDINYRTEETPTDSTNINNGHKYTYDANGSGENEAIYVNSEFSGGNTGTARFSLYVSPYLVAGQGGKYTKHIYIGSQRIVSKLGDLASYGADPRRIPYAGNEADGLTINYKDKYNQQLQSIKDNYKAFDHPYNGKDNDDYVNGQGFCCNDGTPDAAQARAMARTRAANGNFKPNDDYEKMQFYYHPDHLGSSSYITNLDGEVAQHIEYVPFGEVFIEERNNTWNTPYLFNAKEFDEETGMYYYGARYYEPRLSLWISTDPLEEESPIITTYGFCHNNPLILIDPDGMGDYFNEKGVWLGSDGMNDKKVYSAQSVTKSKRGLVNDAKDAKLLGISYDKFVRQASAVYGESSAYLVRNKTDEPSDEMMKEMYAIASVHQRNSKAYGVNSDPAKDFRKKDENQRNELPLMRTAIAAEINALLGGRDYSNGATMWDGAEQAQFSLDDTRRSTGRFEIHMNTMGWKISNEHYAKWKKNVGKSFKAPQTRVAPMYLGGEKKRNMNAGKTRLKSTAVYGRTIFWKETK
ncbi:RHS repeat domain-containing protein, partial [Prevotella corporis]|uniref:RHS repeat domain-containing protein n=1 Tax=Prevotella corporis TaxID=28128 RepID=UPI0023F8B79A